MDPVEPRWWTWMFDRHVLPQVSFHRILEGREAAAAVIASSVIAGTFVVDEEVAVHSPDPSLPATPGTDAEIGAAVHVFMAAVTGVLHPAEAAAERYEHAEEVIAEEVTEVLATLALHR